MHLWWCVQWVLFWALGDFILLRSDRIRNVVWKDEVKRICDNMPYKCGGTYHVTASYICVPWADPTWLDRQGGNKWVLVNVCAVHATNVRDLQRCLHSQTLFRLFPVEDTAVYFYYSFTCQFILFRYGTSHAFRDDDVIQAVEDIVLPLVCFFAMKKNRSSPKIEIFAYSKFYWLLPKKRERFIRKEIQIFFSLNWKLIIVALHF